MIITIDGPAGTGKSTVAKKLADTLGFLHLDTGAFYRSITYGVLSHSISVENQKAIEEFAQNNPIRVDLKSSSPRYFIGNTETTDYIRSQEVTHAVSIISSYPKVREKLVEVQRELAAGINLVCEGRDIGTNVFPQAEIKIFLTARADIRAERRFAEIKAKGLLQDGISIETIQKDIEMRDRIDSTRKINPLIIPDGAHIIDTSTLSINEVLETILSIMKTQ